jgi:hypothetical protein
MESRKEKIASILDGIYKDRASSGGFAGVNGLWCEAKLVDKSITKKDVELYLEGQRTYGLFKPRRLKFPRSKTFAAGYFTDAQADLAGLLHYLDSLYFYFKIFNRWRRKTTVSVTCLWLLTC